MNPEGVLEESLSTEELVPVLETCKNLTSPNLRNKVTSFRYMRRYGVMDNIIKFKGSSKWANFQNNMFAGQASQSNKVFVFKMFEVGLGHGIELVRRMQSSRDLCNGWMMFYYVKGVKGWTTMAYHVYNASYCRVMTIAIVTCNSRMLKLSFYFERI